MSQEVQQVTSRSGSAGRGASAPRWRRPRGHLPKEVRPTRAGWRGGASDLRRFGLETSTLPLSHAAAAAGSDAGAAAPSGERGPE